MPNPAENNLKHRPILLVEDNPMDLDVTLQALAEINITNPVLICRDGEEALTYIQLHTMPEDPQLPALVLLDLHLPKVVGLEVLRLAKQYPVWELIPFIMLSSSCASTDIALAYELDAIAYLTKPVDTTELKNMISNVTNYWLRLRSANDLCSTNEGCSLSGAAVSQP